MSTPEMASGSFKGWLYQVTRCRIADQFRKRLPKAAPAVRGPDEDRTATVDRLPDLSATDVATAWDREWEKNLAHTALERIKRRVHPKQFQMFDLYVTQAWPIRDITETLGVHRTQVYMAKLRISRLLKREVARLSAAEF